MPCFIIQGNTHLNRTMLLNFVEPVETATEVVSTITTCTNAAYDGYQRSLRFILQGKKFKLCYGETFSNFAVCL